MIDRFLGIEEAHRLIEESAETSEEGLSRHSGWLHCCERLITDHEVAIAG
jgi:hypothetical protein